MNSAKLSVAFALLAALAGAAAMNLHALALGDDSLRLSREVVAVCRFVCLGSLGVFLVTFLVGLNRSPLLKRPQGLK